MKGFVTLFTKALVRCLPKIQNVNPTGFSPNSFFYNTKILFMRGIFTSSLVRSEKCFTGSFKILLMLPLLFQYIHSKSLAKKYSLPGNDGEKPVNWEPITIGGLTDLPIVPISLNQFSSGTRRKLSHILIKGVEA